MQDIMRPILQAALPKARIQKHFPRKLVYGTLMTEGFGVYNLLDYKSRLVMVEQ